MHRSLLKLCFSRKDGSRTFQLLIIRKIISKRKLCFASYLLVTHHSDPNAMLKFLWRKWFPFYLLHSLEIIAIMLDFIELSASTVCDKIKKRINKFFLAMFKFLLAPKWRSFKNVQLLRLSIRLSQLSWNECSCERVKRNYIKKLLSWKMLCTNRTGHFWFFFFSTSILQLWYT